MSRFAFLACRAPCASTMTALSAPMVVSRRFVARRLSDARPALIGVLLCSLSGHVHQWCPNRLLGSTVDALVSALP